jgi:hypothetical protein
LQPAGRGHKPSKGAVSAAFVPYRDVSLAGGWQGDGTVQERPDDAEDRADDNNTGQRPEQPMAKSPTQKPAPDAAATPQQQGQEKPAGQMTGTADPKPQQGEPIFRDWAAI